MASLGPIIARKVVGRCEATLAAALAVAVVLVGHDPRPAVALPAQVTCGIDPQSSAAGLDLSAFVLPDKEMAGSFRFGVEQAGSGGYTAVGQSGEFDAAAGIATEVGLIRVGNPQDGSYVARLEIMDASEGTVCAASLP